VLLASAWAPGTRSALSVAAIAIVAIPVAEVAFAVLRRLRARQAITAGDRRHPYDLLVARGWRRSAAAVAYVGGEGLFAVAAVGTSKAHNLAGAVACVCVTAVVVVFLAGVCGALSPEPRAPA
jgi:UDP-GlcNAc:undecaprenyl-phosphate GlcNAc-1-phosphate transferase